MKKLFTNKEYLLLFAILLIASFMRLYRIQDYMTFLGDEGRDVLVAYNILHGHFTLLGPTASVGGFYFGPIYYYFMAPFLWLFNYNPVGPAVMVALFGIAAVWLTYKIGKEFFGNAVGLIAAFMYAISPLVITYSRSSWNPNPVPFFALLVLWFVYKGVTNSSRHSHESGNPGGKKNYLHKFPISPKRISYSVAARSGMTLDFLLAGFFLGIAIELHFIVAILGIAVVLYLLFVYLILERKMFKNLRDCFVAWLLAMASLLIGFFFGWLPYLGFEFRNGFPNTKSVIAFVFHSGKISGDNGNFFMTVGSVFFRLFGRIAVSFPSPDLASAYSQWQLWLWGGFVLILALVSVGILIWQIQYDLRFKIQDLRSKQVFGLILVLFWLVVGILVFGVYKRQIYDYYFGFLFPLPVLLIANLLVFLWRRNVVVKSITVVVFCILIVLNLLGVPFRFPANRQLLQMETIAKFVNDKTDGKPFNFALITGGNSDHAYRYFFTIWGHEPITIQNTTIDPQRKTVTGQLFVVCESIPCEPLGNSLWEIAGFGRAEIAGEWHVSVVDIYKLEPYKGQ